MEMHKCNCTAQSTKEECEADGNNIWTDACGWGYGQPCGPNNVAPATAAPTTASALPTDAG